MASRQCVPAHAQELYSEKDAAEQEIEKEAAAVARALSVTVRQYTLMSNVLCQGSNLALPLKLSMGPSWVLHRLTHLLCRRALVVRVVPMLCCAGDLGLELGKTIKLEWHKAANTRLRCLRITSKEEKAVRKQLGVRRLAARGMRCNCSSSVMPAHAIRTSRLRNMPSGTWAEILHHIHVA